MLKQLETGRVLANGRRVGLGLIAAGILAAVLTACNTTEGVGKDIKSAGEGIEDTARDAKN
ncbi:MAG: entericidin A/B family lipoprotein [Phycisphaerales bacterium]|nr:entericidin A/B family lipoprotein [Phycisphaerales bacterium]